GPKPVVARGQELAVGLAWGPNTAISCPVRLQNHPVHQVMHRLADEQAGGKFGAEEVVTIRCRAVGRGHVASRGRVTEAGQNAADGIKPGVGLQWLFRIGRGVIRIALQVRIAEDVVPAPGRVVVAEPVAPVVAMPTVLRLAALGLELARVGLEPEVAALDVDDLARLDRANRAPTVA